MSTDPQRPIEKLLHDAAQKRREQAGAPFELHPATRKLLQGEVARQFGKVAGQPEPSGFSQRLRQLWPKMVWSFGALAIVGLIAWLVFPAATKSRKEELLAKSDRAMRERSTQAPESDVAVPGAAPEGDRQRQLAAQTPAEMPSVAPDKGLSTPSGVTLADSEKAKAPAEPQPVRSARAAKSFDNLQVPSADEKVLKFSNRMNADSSSSTPAASINAPATPPLAAAGSAAAPNNEAATERNRTTFSLSTPALSAAQRDAAVPSAAPSTEARPAVLAESIAEIPTSSTNALHTVELAQNFRRLDTARTDALGLQDGRAPAQVVLASFQVKQVGQEIQIVDQDGSVYSGYVVPAGASLKSAPLEKEAQAATSSGASRLYSESSSQSVAGMPSSQSLAFRVTGTNSSLNQRVVFSGNLTWLGRTNDAFSARMRNAGGVVGGLAGGGGGGAPVSSVTPDSSIATASHISGNLIIGDGPELEIQAVPAKR
jgi:hypothetical protein